MMPAAFSETSCAKRKSTKNSTGSFSNLLITCLSRSALPARPLGGGPCRVCFFPWHMAAPGATDPPKFPCCHGNLGGSVIVCIRFASCSGSKLARESAAPGAPHTPAAQQRPAARRQLPWTASSGAHGVPGSRPTATRSCSRIPGGNPRTFKRLGRRQFGGRRLEPG